MEFMYKNYIFDLYGTLVDINTDEEGELLWDKLSLLYNFKGANYSSEELADLYLEKVNRIKSSAKDVAYSDFPIEIIFGELYEDKGVKASEELIENTAQIFRILSIKYLRLYDGVIEILDELKNKDKRIYLLSNAQRIFTEYEMKLLGIYHYFDDIFFSSEYRACKPENKFYNAILDTHKLDIKESVMIGNDYIADIQGASAVGIESLYIHSNLSPEIEGELPCTYSVMDYDIKKAMNFILR